MWICKTVGCYVPWLGVWHFVFIIYETETETEIEREFDVLAQCTPDLVFFSDCALRLEKSYLVPPRRNSGIIFRRKFISTAGLLASCHRAWRKSDQFADICDILHNCSDERCFDPIAILWNRHQVGQPILPCNCGRKDFPAANIAGIWCRVQNDKSSPIRWRNLEISQFEGPSCLFTII